MNKTWNPRSLHSADRRMLINAYKEIRLDGYHVQVESYLVLIYIRFPCHDQFLQIALVFSSCPIAISETLGYFMIRTGFKTITTSTLIKSYKWRLTIFTVASYEDHHLVVSRNIKQDSSLIPFIWNTNYHTLKLQTVQGPRIKPHAHSKRMSDNISTEWLQML